MTDGFQCEQCNEWGEEPAAISKVPGFEGVIHLKFCEDCADKKEKTKR